LKVVTRVAPPFIIQGSDGSLSGYSWDLLQFLSQQLGRPVDPNVTVAGNVTDLLQIMQSGTSDLGIAAVSITADRDKVVDFSQPMFAAGLQVMVQPAAAQSPSVFSTVIGVLTSSGAIKLGLIILAAIVVLAHLIYFSERGQSDGFLEDKSYLPGVLESGWWAFSAMVAQEQHLPQRWISRLVTTIWIFFGVTFVALFTAAITSALTVDQITGGIQGLSDLKDKQVATVDGSTAAAYLSDQGFDDKSVQKVQNVADAEKLLVDGKVDGVVYDAPILQYYATHDGKGKAMVVGTVFKPENYGIVFPTGSPLRRDVDQALLALNEQGKIADLQKKWFTPDTGSN
jgi:polar amino acid transport system substrate-binding protein